MVAFQAKSPTIKNNLAPHRRVILKQFLVAAELIFTCFHDIWRSCGEIAGITVLKLFHCCGNTCVLVHMWKTSIHSSVVHQTHVISSVVHHHAHRKHRDYSCYSWILRRVVPTVIWLFGENVKLLFICRFHCGFIVRWHVLSYVVYMLRSIICETCKIWSCNIQTTVVRVPKR